MYGNMVDNVHHDPLDENDVVAFVVAVGYLVGSQRLNHQFFRLCHFVGVYAELVFATKHLCKKES